MPSGENEPLNNRQPIRTKAESFFSTYANSVQLEMTPWDFKFLFGILKVATEQKLEVEDSAQVYMSPQHAKVFAAVLVRHLKQYEQQFGTIPGPAGAPSEVPQEPTS
jgi:hypothetical protein